MQQREGLIAALALGVVLVLACKPAPVNPVPLAPVVTDTVWRLAGRVQMQPRLSDAPPFEGAARLLAQCGDERPCAAELWRGDRGGELNLLRRGERIAVAEPVATLPSTPWRAKWRALGNTLGACLGDPLSGGFTGDPAARRELRSVSNHATWVLVLSGNNRCALQGEIGLDLVADRVDTTALRVLDDVGRAVPWTDAGRRLAATHLKSFLATHAAELYAAADPEGQALLLRHLAADPELAAQAAELNP